MIQACLDIGMKEAMMTENIPNWARADWASISERN
jgi:hypothetical protein